ncbi:hypothetical protein Pint_20369 [Pistacia integerrima]|uniref:Uncharacterized protein n=1 Tax=Pistacia integerrima TaxID=434235 RepID=A0ACC0XCG8_9ROSI|nr:hypothetical protein Pint_20369 [Pistacia integerrima]
MVGFNLIASLFLMMLVHVTMSYVTLPNWLPSPLFSIYIQSTHKAKHGSDSGTYDTEGRFIPAEFESMFSKYARTSPDKLTPGELWRMTQSNHKAFGFFGWYLLFSLSFSLSCTPRTPSRRSNHSFLKPAFLRLKSWDGLTHAYLALDEEGYLSKDAVRHFLKPKLDN